jgi:hypothetical protein
MSNDLNRAASPVVIDFPLTSEIAARRYERELERVARLDYVSALTGKVKLHRVSRHVLNDYHRLVSPVRLPPLPQ